MPTSKSLNTWRSRAFPILLALACVLTVGCKVRLISGPQVVEVGNTVSYTLGLTGSLSNTIRLAAEVPLGWDLQSSTFEGTIDGEPVAGNALVVQANDCGGVLGEIRAGFRRWYFENPNFPLQETLLGASGPTEGEVTLEFQVKDQPVGEHQIRFVFAGVGNSCSPPLVVTLNADPAPTLMPLIQTLVDGVDGVDGLGRPQDATVSPDGGNVYVAASADSAIGVFSRDPASGLLSFVEAETDGFAPDDGFGPPNGVVVSPDAASLYVSRVDDPGTGRDSAVGLYLRDSMTGALTFDEVQMSEAERSVVSSDGTHVYAGDTTNLWTYSRDPMDGRLTSVTDQSIGGERVLSPDGEHLYATDLGEINIYARDSMTGLLTFVDFVVPAISIDPIAMSPDGRHIYVLAPNTVGTYARDAGTGLLSAVGDPLELGSDVPSMNAEAIVVSPDGSFVAVGGRVGMMLFLRDRTTGALTLVETQYLGDLRVACIRGVGSLAFSPDSQHLYATVLEDDAILTFETPLLFSDGFESGSTSAWSSTQP